MKWVSPNTKKSKYGDKSDQKYYSNSDQSDWYMCCLMWLQAMLHVFCGNIRSAYPDILGTFVILNLEGTSCSEYSSKKKLKGYYSRVSSLLVLRSNLHGRILSLPHFAIYKRVNPVQPLLCALLWVTGLGYHLVPGPFLWINIYLPYIMSGPLKNNQNYTTNQWSSSLLQKITHHSLMLKNWICSTIQRFFFVIDVIQSK